MATANLCPLDLSKSSDGIHLKITELYQELGTKSHLNPEYFVFLNIFLFCLADVSRLSQHRQFTSASDSIFVTSQPLGPKDLCFVRYVCLIACLLFIFY